MDGKAFRSMNNFEEEKRLKSVHFKGITPGVHGFRIDAVMSSKDVY